MKLWILKQVIKVTLNIEYTLQLLIYASLAKLGLQKTTLLLVFFNIKL